MKKIAITTTLLLSVFAFSSFMFLKNTQKEKNDMLSIKASVEKHKINWISFEEAIEKTAIDKKPIFVDVYTDWCGWCKKMDKNTFQTEEVSEYVAQNYHAVKLDAESEKTLVFEKQTLTYRQLSGGVFRVTGYPSIVLINHKKEIAVAPGYRDKAAFVEMLKQFKTFKKENAKD